MLKRNVLLHTVTQNFLPSIPRQRQQLDQRPELRLVHVAEGLLMLRIRRLIEMVNEFPAFFRDVRVHLPPVRLAALPRHQTRILHAVEKPSRVGHPVEKPLTHLVPAKTLRLSSPEDPENVVLRPRDPIGLEHLLERVAKNIRGALDVQLSLLMKTPERPRLLDFFPQRR